LDAKIWHEGGVLDRFDLQLLNLVQGDDSQTAGNLARHIALSPSAIARRLRRLRGEGWISRTIALLSRRLTHRRLRAIVTVELGEHADHQGKAALIKRIESTAQVQFCYELAGIHDLLLLFDCTNMAEFNATAEAVLVADNTVRRYETYFVKQELKFEPFVQIDADSLAG
jgi:Lrp/AsnC family transcriptional regulator, leucine-responsive regulatory protein